MPAAQVYRPFEELRDALRAARERGEPFEKAWDQALAEIRWPRDPSVRTLYSRALRETQGEWKAAYTGHPSRLTGAIGHLAAALGEIEHAELEGAPSRLVA